MQKVNKLSAGFVVVSMMGAVSVFAMDTMATGTMMHEDKMMTASGTMMTSATGTAKVIKMMDQMDDGLMMKIDKNSSKEEIMKLQEMLIKKGHLKIKKGARLGFFGPATMKALEMHKKMSMKMMHDDKMMMATGTMMKATDTMMHQ